MTDKLLMELVNEISEKQKNDTLTIRELDDMMYDCVNKMKDIVCESVSNTLNKNEVKKNVQIVKKKTDPKNTTQ